MWEEWVIDAGFDHGDTGIFTFIPVEHMDDAERRVFVTGLAMIADAPPPPGRLRGLIHEQGQEAADAFYEKHQGAIERLRARLKEEGRG